MKTLFRLFKPLIKSILIAQMKSNQDLIINLLLKKVVLPNLAGETEEKIFNDLYDTLETIIAAQIEAV
jgi:hypothetical protein